MTDWPEGDSDPEYYGGPIQWRDEAISPEFDRLCGELLRKLPPGRLIWSITPTGLHVGPDPDQSPDEPHPMTDPMHYPFTVETIAMGDNLSIDEQVAKAIGLVYLGFCRRGPVYGRSVDEANVQQYECGVSWRPSVHWHDALEAAERFPPFVKNMVLFPARDEATPNGPIVWCVAPVNSANELGDAIITNRSGPRAVSLAILVLHDQMK